MPLKTRILNILFWSVLSAAFIGPGTITTAASAGSGYGFSLVWALLFSTVACVVLQEASARLTVASGNNLGQVIRQRFHKTLGGKFLTYLVLSAILLGCAAYEAGNILGGVAGILTPGSCPFLSEWLPPCSFGSGPPNRLPRCWALLWA